MNKKGFTLIELLAVIVILAVIALIVTPTINGIIEKSNKSAAKVSANGYIDAIDKYLMSNTLLDNKTAIQDGIYKEGELSIDYSGKGPDDALVTIEEGTIKKAKICINKYSFDYDGESVIYSVNNYCSNNYKVTLLIDDNEEEKNIEKELSTTFEISEITNKTNVLCNNGATSKIENNTLTISNIFGDTTCSINNSLEDAINSLDNTQNSILMINDEEINNTLAIKENKNVALDLNGFDINGMCSVIFSVSGQFTIDDNTKKSVLYLGNTENSINAINIGGTIANLHIKYLKIMDIIKTEDKNRGIWITSTCKKCNVVIDYANIDVGKYPIGIHGSAMEANVIINDGIYISNAGRTIENNGKNNLNINGGIFISNNSHSVINITVGTININQTDTPIYITSLAQKWAPAISNYSTGAINIKAIQADNCTNNPEDTTSGLCVYVPDGLGNGALQNNKDGKVYIDGGTYYGDIQGINNGSGGTININNAYINSNMSAILNNSTGAINICKSILNGNPKDFYNSSTGTINYSSNVIFTNGTNTPNVYNQTGTINANYTGTCLSN